jgi:hypothetical protein
MKSLSNKWLNTGNDNWFYIINDYGRFKGGNIVDAVSYYRPVQRGPLEIEFINNYPIKFTKEDAPFEPTLKQKRLVLKGVFR